MPVRNRLRNHMVKVEYLASEETIFLMMAQGYSKRLIHERLTEERKISMAYITLCQFIRRAKKKEPVAPVPDSRNTALSISPARQPSKIVKASSNTLQDPRTVDPSTLF